MSTICYSRTSLTYCASTYVIPIAAFPMTMQCVQCPHPINSNIWHKMALVPDDHNSVTNVSHVETLQALAFLLT